MNKEKLIEEHSKLIYKIANYYKESASIEDLYQVGVIGLLKAYNNYNNESNAKFSTYAFEYIRGEMLAYIKGNNTIKVSKEYLTLRKRYEKAKEMISQKLDRCASHTEICLYLEIDENLMNQVLSITDNVLSLDYQNEDDNLYDYISSDNMNMELDKIYLNDLIDRLDPLEKKIIEYRYFNDYTQQEIANMLGISQIQVCRYEKKSILKLQKIA